MIWVNRMILLSWNFDDRNIMIWTVFNFFKKLIIISHYIGNIDILDINENKFSEIYIELLDVLIMFMEELDSDEIIFQE